MILTSLLIASIIVLSIWTYRSYKPYFDTTKEIGHRSKNLTLAVLKLNLNNAIELARSLVNGFDSVFFGPYFLQIIRDPEDLKIIFNSDETFEKTIFNGFYFHYGLFSDGGDLYKRQRKAISPLFASGRLRQITPIINENMSDFLKLYESIRVPELVDFNQIAAYFALSSSLYTLFNVDIKDYDTLTKAITKFRRFLFKNTERFVNPFLYPYFLFKRSKLGRLIWSLKLESFRTMQLDKLKLTNDNEKDGMKFYYDYISKTEFDQKDSDRFIDSISMVMGASFVTTSDALAGTLLLLAMNPEKQEMLYNELTTVLGSADEFVTEEKCNQMPFLGMVLKESMRLFPAAVVMARKVTSDLKLTKYTARAGSYAVIPMLDIHTDKKLWGDDALDFRPERFEDENMKSIHPYAYIPFSKGPRICPGYKHSVLTMKIFLCRFLMKYRVSTPLKYKELTMRFSLTLTIKERHMMKVELRE